MTAVTTDNPAPVENGTSSAPDSATLKRKAAVGSVWLVCSRLSMKLVDMATLLLLARLLTPSDFGLVALSMAPIFIVEAIMELPVNQALVRIADVTGSQIDTAFTVSLLRGAVVATVLCALSAPLAYVFRDPRITSLVCVLSLAPAARGLVNPRVSEYTRAMKYHLDFVLTVIPKILSLVAAVGIACGTRSYWSIAAGTVCTPVAMVMISYIIVPYRPRLSLVHFDYFKDFVGWMTAAQAINAVNWQSDKLILGRFAPAAILGQFSLGNDVAYIPEQTLFKTTLGTYFAAFSHAREDPDQLRHLYIYFLKSVVAVGLPVLAGLSALARPAVAIAFGHRWLAVAPFLQILALSLTVPLIAAPLGPLAMAVGRNKVFLYRSTLELSLKLPVVFLATLYCGPLGTAWSRVVSETVTAIFSMQLVRALIGVPVREQVGSCAPYFLGAAVMYAMLLASGVGAISSIDAGGLARIAGWSLLGALVYAATVYGSWIVLKMPSGPERFAHRLLLRALPSRSVAV